MRSLLRQAVTVLLFALAASCNDITPPRMSAPRSAAPDIEITVTSLTVSLRYGGELVGTGASGDHCFSVAIDGTSVGNVCGQATLQNVPSGVHSVRLRQTHFPDLMFEDVLDPVTVDLVVGQTNAVEFDIAAIRGVLTGRVTLNGSPAPSGQYAACVDGPGGCAGAFGSAGQFAMMVRPGSFTGYITSMFAATGRLASFPFEITPGTTTDVGVLAIETASLTVALRYAGNPLPMSAAGDHCFQVAVDGVRRGNVCSQTTIHDLPVGTHSISLQQTHFPDLMQEDVLSPVVVELGATTATATFDITAIRGQVSGVVTLNGSPAPSGQYSACLDGSGCATIFGDAGRFTSFVRPGAGSGYITSMFTTGGPLVRFTFAVAAGASTDVGTLAIEASSLAVVLRYADAPLSLADGGDHCFAVLVDGVVKGNVCTQTTIQNLPGGTHRVSLQQTHFPDLAFEDVLATQTLELGVSTATATFDIGSIRGKYAGTLRVNGEPAPSGQYSACTDGGGCTGIFGAGQFSAFIRPGRWTGYISSMFSGGRLATYSFIVAAGQTTLLGGVSTAPGITPSGPNRPVQPLNSSQSSGNTTINLIFSNVEVAGTTSVSESGTGPALPQGLSLGTPPVFYDLSTTAAFSGPVEVCINYTGTTFTDVDQLKLLHGDGNGSWAEVTTRHDQGNRIICGSVTSFSPFVVAEGATAPADVTPPEISSAIDGTAGAAGWYTSDAKVTWSVSDAQSAVASSSGCDAAAVTADVAEVSFTCTATSTGGTASKTVTVKRDATAPSVTGTPNGAVGRDGWFTSDVAVVWSASDDISGVAAEPCVANTLAADNAGVSFTCTATNAAGLSASATVEVRRDASAPVITPSVSGTRGTNGWYVSDVRVGWSVSSAGPSGVSPCAPSSQSSDTPGAELSCTATTGAGVSRTESVPVKRDATIPAISWTGAGAYTIDQTVSIVCTASDATSGVAASTCANVSGPAYSLPIGPTTLTATAADFAGNTASATTSYSVSVTSASLCILTLRWLNSDKGGELCSKLQNRDLTGYIRAVLGSGPLLTPERAAILVKLARKLASEL